MDGLAHIHRDICILQVMGYEGCTGVSDKTETLFDTWKQGK